MTLLKHVTLPGLLMATLYGPAQTRVMTYNIRNSHAQDGINNWEKRMHKTFDLIRKANPDILGTQEVIYDQLKDLEHALPTYRSFGAGRNNGKHAGEHSAIFYKTAKYQFIQGGNFWLSQTPDLPGSKSWDAAITRICTWVQLKEKTTGQILFVFNTHFDHKGQQARVKSAALLRHAIDSIANGNPVLVTGDFNFTPLDEGYKLMTLATGFETDLTDTYETTQPDYTACGFEVANTNCHRIDYILCSPHFKHTNYILHTDNNGIHYPSDHLAVSAVVE